MIVDGKFTIIGKDGGKHHFEIKQYSDWASISLEKHNGESIKFRIEKTQLAALSLLLFHISCTQRIGEGWNTDEVVHTLLEAEGDSQDFVFLSENLQIVQTALNAELEKTDSNGNPIGPKPRK